MMFKMTMLGMMLALSSCAVSREEVVLKNSRLDYQITYFDDYALIEINQIEMSVFDAAGASKRKNSIKGPSVKAEYNKPFSSELGGMMNNNSVLINFTVSGNIVKIGNVVQSCKITLESNSTKSL